MHRQSSFTDAVLDPDRAAPGGVNDGFGGPAGKRFDVYRNNVVVSLTEALETGFPVLRKLVGDAFFKAMAGVFVRAHPPASPRLQLYGQRLPGFLASFPPVAHLPYLPDIARLELGLRQSYHAADAAPLDVGGLDPDAMLALKPLVAPATLVVQSRYPIFAIWRANTDSTAPGPAAGAQDILITRPGFDPAPHLLPRGGVALARLLKGRISLAEAMAATLAAEPEADISALLSLFIASGALTLERKDP
ncbi:DNA-binding domain-containing protein [Boseongicola sp. H5]|uniref:HvfC/BufC N-terminal domain-containing protein n=1 Tax=Boseongicola sp. H5 TaxID=2763261 RepID=UPI001D0B5EBD|nr:DNA-binding domain-containing protein [Boseongicola sp. H5]